MKIAMFDTKPYDKEVFTKWNKKYKDTNIKYFEESLSLNNILLTKDCEIVCVFVNDDIDTEIIKKLSEHGVKTIALRCAGYNNVDLKAAEEYGITVFRVPAYSPYAIAEHTLALLMTLNRKIHKAYNRTRDGNFNIDGLKGFDLHGKTAGIIGTGKIATIFIQILKGLGMNVIAYDKFPNENLAKEKDFKYVELDELYAKSDVISLHCPLTPETYHMINADSFKKMKKGTILINTSRGKLVDTSLLIEALKDGTIGAVGLDVYEEEQKVFYEDRSNAILQDDVLARILAFNNVIVTSHQAFLTNEALDNIAETTFENIKNYTEGNPILNEVYYDKVKDNIIEGQKK